MPDAISQAIDSYGVLSHTVFTEAVAQTYNKFILQWKGAKTVEEREQYHAQVIAMDTVLATLRGYVEEGYKLENRGRTTTDIDGPCTINYKMMKKGH